MMEKLGQKKTRPINPTTKVEFSIPKTAFVTLKVHDILGKAVAILVNEKKTGREV